MGIRVALPDLDHWKAQVKCQSGCPVSTDAVLAWLIVPFALAVRALSRADI
jgi:hypothetical protein